MPRSRASRSHTGARYLTLHLPSTLRSSPSELPNSLLIFPFLPLPQPLDLTHGLDSPARTFGSSPHRCLALCLRLQKSPGDNPDPGTLIPEAGCLCQHSHPLHVLLASFGGGPGPTFRAENPTKGPLKAFPEQLSLSNQLSWQYLQHFGRHISQCKFPNWYSGLAINPL